MRLKEMSHTDLFLTMYLRPKVCAEVITRGRLPVVGALCCVLRDGGWFMVWGQELLPSHLPDTALPGEEIALRGKSWETGRLETGKRDKNTQRLGGWELLPALILPRAACCPGPCPALPWDGAVLGAGGVLGSPGQLVGEGSQGPAPSLTLQLSLCC